jgi:hypothetical protein
MLNNLPKGSSECFRTAIRCGESFPPSCPYFKTIAEEAILNSLREISPKSYAPRFFLIVARQGTGKSALATHLYDNILNNLSNVIPVLLCGREDLATSLSTIQRELESKLSFSLSKWLEIHKNIRKTINKDLETLSLILELSDLMPFIIIDEAHMIKNLDALMSQVRSLESSMKLAGVMLLFQDLSEEQERKIYFQLQERGGSRFIWERLTTRELIPSGEELSKIEEWAAFIFNDKIASKVYTEIASTYGFRPANHFGLAYIEPKGKGELNKVSAAVVKALSEKYKVPKEQPIRTSSIAGARADLLFGNNIYFDVKVCSDAQSLKKAIEEDRAKGINPIYIVVGNCNVPGLGVKAIPVMTNVDSVAYAIKVTAYSIGIEEDILYKLVGNVIAENIDLELIGIQQPPEEELITTWATELCEETGKEGIPRSEFIKKRQAKQLASILGIPLSKADDATKLVQELQRRRLPFRFTLIGNKRVKCERAMLAPSLLDKALG